MQPSILGSAASLADTIPQGREAATKAYGGVSTGRAKYSSNPSNPQPEYPAPTPAQDASNLALAGSTAAVPFTGGLSLLPRLGLMGFGAAAGSAGGQLWRNGKVDPNQTAGDITHYGVEPELAASAGLGFLRNAGRIGRTALAGTSAAAGRLPFVGAPLRAGLRAGMREWNELAPTYRDATALNKIPYAGEDAEFPAVQGAAARPRLLMGETADAAAKPSGRLVLSPEEAQRETQQMLLAKRLASQRGMQYAAGQRPTNPGTR
jgi:hypothetical protein